MVEISEKLVRRINSPLFWVLRSLTGVSVSFAPLGLLMLGVRNTWGPFEISGAAICFALIFLVPFFHARIINEVIRQVIQK